MTQTYIQEGLDEEEYKDFQNSLTTPPGEKVRPRSRVSPQLLEMMRPKDPEAAIRRPDVQVGDGPQRRTG